MPPSGASGLHLRPVGKDDWRAVCALEVEAAQRPFVAEPSYYLALCCYEIWNPLAVYLDDAVVGFMMWGVDDDGSVWLGGILIDRKHQRRGYGRQAVREAVSLLSEREGASEFALSYQPANTVARRLYASLGFVETGETEGDEVVARMRLRTDVER